MSMTEETERKKITVSCCRNIGVGVAQRVIPTTKK